VNPSQFVLGFSTSERKYYIKSHVYTEGENGAPKGGIQNESIVEKYMDTDQVQFHKVQCHIAKLIKHYYLCSPK
jgi:hypothetical protein